MSGRVHATVKIACVEDCAVRAVLFYLMCCSQTYTKCISALVPLRKITAIPVVVHIVMPSVYQTKFIDATPVNKSRYSALCGLLSPYIHSLLKVQPVVTSKSLNFAHKECFCVSCIFRVGGNCFREQN